MHLYPAAVAWTLGGIVGGIFRVLLCTKFFGDLRLSEHLPHINGLRIALSKRAIETTILHLSINIGIIGVGVSAMFQTPPTTATQSGVYSIVVTAFLVLIPWVLVYDAAREYVIQIAFINTHYVKEQHGSSS